MTTRPAPAEPARPVPYALTPKAHAALANPASSAIATCCRRKDVRSPNG